MRWRSPVLHHEGHGERGGKNRKTFYLARQEIYFDRQFGLDETLQGIERVRSADVQRVAWDLFKNGSLAATVQGLVNGLHIPRERLDLDEGPVKE